MPTLTPASAALLRDVVNAIIESGYAKVPPRTRIARLAQDERIESRSFSTELIDDIVQEYGVKRSTARGILNQARRKHEQQHHEAKGQGR